MTSSPPFQNGDIPLRYKLGELASKLAEEIWESVEGSMKDIAPEVDDEELRRFVEGGD